jgi:hypothetical protein
MATPFMIKLEGAAVSGTPDEPDFSGLEGGDEQAVARWPVGKVTRPAPVAPTVLCGR